MMNSFINVFTGAVESCEKIEPLNLSSEIRQVFFGILESTGCDPITYEHFKKVMIVTGNGDWLEQVYQGSDGRFYLALTDDSGETQQGEIDDDSEYESGMYADVMKSGLLSKAIRDRYYGE